MSGWSIHSFRVLVIWMLSWCLLGVESGGEVLCEGLNIVLALDIVLGGDKRAMRKMLREDWASL